MESKSIKISKENYEWLLNIIIDIQKERKKFASFDDAINELKENNCKNVKNIMEFAGIWEDMTDKEAEELKRDLKKGWGKWKVPSL
jgi:hypothetical protein